MSGGSHNYIAYKINDELCNQMHDKELDDMMRDISDLAHDLEWYDSGDIGREDYLETVKAFKKKWFGSDREERLRGYIDESINKLRRELYSLVGDDIND